MASLPSGLIDKNGDSRVHCVQFQAISKLSKAMCIQNLENQSSRLTEAVAFGLQNEQHYSFLQIGFTLASKINSSTIAHISCTMKHPNAQHE
jgi:hypothetical protein